jgi:MFS family permease
MWNIAHNLGGFAAPLIAGGFAKSMGWKWGMWAPGIIGLVVGVIVLLVTRWVAVCGAGINTQPGGQQVAHDAQQGHSTVVYCQVGSRAESHGALNLKHQTSAQWSNREVRHYMGGGFDSIRQLHQQ